MKKSELVNAIVESADISKAKAGLAVGAITSAITKALADGDQVTLVGFGTFSVHERAARKGCNPRSGQEIQLAAAKLPPLKWVNHLKEPLTKKRSLRGLCGRV
ncbi:MAG: DNA-binding protein HU-beta [Oleiphilaceae bacterium]|jgi:DNA-binding protein HU-beta